MFTVSLSFYSENAKRAAFAFSKFLLTGGHSTINTELSEKEGSSANITMMVSTANPELLFKCLEDYAMGGVQPPEGLQDIYFEEMVYHIHSMPADITTEKLMTVLNFSLNMGSVLRVQHSRLRNMVNANGMGDDFGGSDRDYNAVQQAINVLSQKVLGHDILKIINQKEEVTWPVH